MDQEVTKGIRYYCIGLISEIYLN